MNAGIFGRPQPIEVTGVSRCGSVSRLAAADLNDVAAVHCYSFTQGLLTALGKSIVRRYYEWQLLGPHESTALGVYKDGELAGFSFAGMFHGSLAGFLRANRIPVAWNALIRPWLLAHPSLRRRGVAVVRSINPFATREEKDVISFGPRTFGILALAVHPKFRRSGYGRLLMNACERVARSQGFSLIRLTVQIENHGAIQFYESLGWRKVLGKSDWCGVMSKELTSYVTALECEEDG
jgi:ribosomal protein S18 acetylase RimI-like enzyme